MPLCSEGCSGIFLAYRSGGIKPIVTEIFAHCPFTQGALTSDKAAYVNQAGLDCTGVPLMPVNGRILLANLLLRDRATVATSDSPCSWAFNDGICEAQFSALGGSPTVSARFVDRRRCGRYPGLALSRNPMQLLSTPKGRLLRYPAGHTSSLLPRQQFGEYGLRELPEAVAYTTLPAGMPHTNRETR
jgi:hypothetical protein